MKKMKIPLKINVNDLATHIRIFFFFFFFFNSNINGRKLWALCEGISGNVRDYFSLLILGDLQGFVILSIQRTTVTE